MGIIKTVTKAGKNIDQNLISWLRLIRSENVGPITFYKLLERYGSADKALEALPEMAKKGGKAKPLFIPHTSVVEKEIRVLEKLGGKMITANSSHYPLALTAIADAPPVISVIGNIDLLNKSCLGIVGARNASLNGRKFAEKIASELGEAGHIVVSGLARGIDTSAHKGSIKTGTIAVVAGGIDVIYPPENQDLYEEIKKHGLIIAESPVGQKPFAQSFPRRNRIVSGVSAGTVVVEATMRSGSLITSRLAAEQGRDVFAVPGHPFDPRAAGPNHLIRDGAVLIRSTDDILESLSDYSAGQAFEDNQQDEYERNNVISIKDDEQSLSEARIIILSNLSFTPISLDEIIRETDLPVALVQAALLELELAGKIERLPGNKIMQIEQDG